MNFSLPTNTPEGQKKAITADEKIITVGAGAGTGKTWVLNALLIWQYLNAKYYDPAFAPVKYTKNFLIIAPGLIVYERLLDAFKGKEQPDKTRDFNTSDIKQNEELFLPDRYRDDIYSFVHLKCYYLC